MVNELQGWGQGAASLNQRQAETSTAGRWRNQASVEERTDERDVVQPHDGMFLGLKKQGHLPPAATWMNLEDIKLGERSQKQRVKYNMVPFIRGP